MFKTAPGKGGRLHHGGGTGLRGRDTEVPGAPISVSDRAQALPLDLNTIRQFSFGQPDRSKIPERPSTSGGPATSSDFPLRRDARKRETRDDFDFPPLSTHGKQTTFYDFPLPGGLPTPDSSPKDFPLPARKSSLARSPTPESIEIDQTMNVREMGIGMAIGSPTHAPAAWQPQRLGHTHSPSPDPTEASLDRSPIPPKHKSKWKMFGGLFGGGKKHPSVQAQNFYQLQAEKPPAEVDQRGQPARGWTSTERTSEKKKPDVHRANTAPTRFDLDYGRDQNPEILIDGNRLEDSTQQRANGGLMLDVNIPSVEMERYSVMFGSLLQKQPATTQSLLARRQATLDRLKVVNEELAQKEQELEEKEKQIKHPRRATSPQPTRSPAFSLFPNTPSRESRLGRAPSPNGRLVRSNTSPAALSPSRPSFAPGPDNEIHATLMEPGPHIPTPGYESASTHDRSTSLTPKPKKKPDLKSIVKLAQAQAATDLQQQQTRSFTPDQSHLTLSPDSDIYDTSPLPMRPSAPQMMSKYTTQNPQPIINTSAGSTTSQSDHSTSSSISTTISTPSSQALSPQSGSPQAQNSAKALPIPMSKFTSPPQAHKTRGRSATTTSQIPVLRTRASDISGPANLSSSPSQTGLNQNSVSNSPRPAQKKNVEEENEEEERLKSLADVSIARQISVSRQQRQLLIPIKGSFRGKPSLVTAKSSSPSNTSTRPTMRTRASTVSSSSPMPSIAHNQNFPSPLHNLQSGINVSHVTSPLSAVEKATKEEWDNTHNLQVSGQSKSRKDKERERLVAGVKPSTPTLVIVGGNGSSSQEDVGVRNWDGSVISAKKGDGIAERRRRARAEKDGRGHEYKKSEKVVVERV